MFKFVSSRFSEFDNVALLDTLDKFQIGEKLWIDDTGAGKWGVYERTNNFDSSLATAPLYDYSLTVNQKFGEIIAGNSAGTHILVGAPKFYNPFLGVYGRIYAYRKDGTGTNNLNLIGSLYPNYSAVSTYFTGTNISNYGTSIKLDSDTDYVIAGAPTASGVDITIMDLINLVLYRQLLQSMVQYITMNKGLLNYRDTILKQLN